jgi:hypothetical protein
MLAEIGGGRRLLPLGNSFFCVFCGYTTKNTKEEKKTWSPMVDANHPKSVLEEGMENIRENHSYYLIFQSQK